jgi:hypothetical protein
MLKAKRTSADRVFDAWIYPKAGIPGLHLPGFGLINIHELSLPLGQVAYSFDNMDLVQVAYSFDNMDLVEIENERLHYSYDPGRCFSLVRLSCTG